MKTGLLAFVLMHSWGDLVLAVAPPPPQKEPQPWLAKTFGPPANLVHDFGTVPRGAQLRHDFVMTNVSAVPLEITSIRVN